MKTPICKVCETPKVLDWEGKWKCPECRKVYQKRYREGHLNEARKRDRERKRADYYKSKANKRRQWLSGGDVTREELIDLYGAHEGHCYYCHKLILRASFNPTDPRGFDHLIAMARGGQHTITNMVPCCKQCNNEKSDKTESEYRRYLKNLAKCGAHIHKRINGRSGNAKYQKRNSLGQFMEATNG